jgi:hypothetical protein
VIPAAHEEVESVNPFDDPFGDRVAQNAGQPAADGEWSRAEEIEQTDPPAAAGPDVGPTLAEPPLAADPLPSEATEQSPLQAPAPPAEMQLDSPLQAPKTADPLTTDPGPPDTVVPGPGVSDDIGPVTDGAATEEKRDEEKPCWQFFAERDFCDEQSECKRAWEAVRDNPLYKISLNISPGFKPDEEDPEEAAKYRQERLAQNAHRKWTSHWNRPLGIMDGKIYGLDGADWEADFAATADFRRPVPLEGRWLRDSDDGKSAIVELADGTTVELPWDKLGRDDRLFIRGRPWVDRLGRKRAFGRLQDYYNGDVFIVGEDGKTEKVPFLALNEDAMAWVTAYWFIPAECKLPDELLKMPEDRQKLRDYTMITYTWKASALCHKPLYFEQRALERYGHSTGPISQPILSGAHFFSSFFAWPYMMGCAPPHECEYALGFYRPGSCAPYMIPPIPLSPRGALLQAGTVVGLVYLLP